MTLSQKTKYRIIDGLLIAMMILPLAAAIVIKILTQPYSEGMNITGALIFLEIPMPFQPLLITEAQVNSWLVMISIAGLCLYLTHGIKAVPDSKRQHIAEMIVEKVEAMVLENMGEMFTGFAPFIAAIMALSAFSSLLTLIGVFPPTSDLNIIAGWAILVFILITYYKLKGGLWNYIKGFGDPIFVMAPMNVISEVATPLSMTFRHFGNVISGVVISALLGSALSGITSKWPGLLGQIPFLKIGIPAVLSLYFDIFSGCMQAFIFASLTMIYISTGFPGEAYEKRMKRKIERAKKKEEAKRLAELEK